MFGCLSLMPISPSRRNSSMNGLLLLPVFASVAFGLLYRLRSTFTANILPVCLCVAR